ncbi:helix-turn-helix transcriptional regulator [Sorangium sp. So ce119]|uniref:response regulator transcription factor n=1 Tax=Sorangium sp. So ce119 TaxID=3133279 RepID=UPI003F625A4E
MKVSRAIVGGCKLVIVSFRVTEAPSPLGGLSEAERAVVRHALAGESNAQIAARRGVSARTVANQLASAYRKLKVGSRAELAAVVHGADARARADA